ncbi:Tim44 domain-containing protein [Enterovirga aerilata]|uniref:TIM44-like domain-containing protein n=1 Tax=Enterovirga aerilata TaxID=2730920 RepID=A0A849IEA8_9HYPH|nr:TIM44-like domain-containing protein [Enterovirga sp. DB1703]NNM74390.1 TIM44-like domain-containing protein [Enterovirga sp. DB1703]
MTKGLSFIARVAALAALGIALAAPATEARVGGGRSSGSRGGQTWSAPPSTATAPRTAQPMQRTETPNLGAQQRPGMPGAATAGQAGRFGGFGTGLMAGLLGAGLLGMLFGGGLFGGLSGLASLFGLLLQVALIAGLVWLALRFFRRRSEPAMAGAGAPYQRSALGGAVPGGVGMGGGSARVAGAPVQIGPADYEAFERALHDIQGAYSREDMQALTYMATPEMVRYFGADLEENRSQGLRNDLRDPKLLQGDLAQAWREGTTEYATVAMRFSLLDTMVDRQTGRIVSGDPRVPQEATELWTFRRDNGGKWLLSAIQQTA